MISEALGMRSSFQVVEEPQVIRADGDSGTVPDASEKRRSVDR
jgi:hypothetical protein